jgi:hypothetical protein
MTASIYTDKLLLYITKQSQHGSGKTGIELSKIAEYSDDNFCVVI